MSRPTETERQLDEFLWEHLGDRTINRSVYRGAYDRLMQLIDERRARDALLQQDAEENRLFLAWPGLCLESGEKQELQEF